MIIPKVTMPTKKASSWGLIAFLIIIIEGRDKAVTAIMKDRIVPMPTSLAKRASAMGMVPKISAYKGMPTTLARNTDKGLFSPSTVCIHSLGIQL